MASRAVKILNAFNAGELSPLLMARMDYAKYENGAEVIENWTPLPQGGAETSDGTRFVKAVKDSTKQGRLIPFVFGTLDAYMLEFGDLYFRVYKNNAPVLLAGVPVEVVTPYPHTVLFGLKYVQDAGDLYLVHPLYQTQVITRTSDTVWTCVPFVSLDGPFLDENRDNSISVYYGGGGGELITNGHFPTNVAGWVDHSQGTGLTGWNALTRADLTNGAGAGDYGLLAQRLSLIPGKSYTITFDVFGNNLAILQGFNPDGSGGTTAAYAPGAGQTFTFAPVTEVTYVAFKSTSLGATTSFDNVTMVKALHKGSGDFSLISNVNLFQAGHVGALWRVRDGNGSPSETPWKLGVAYVVGNRVVNADMVYECVTAGTSGNQPPVHLEGAASDGGAVWAFINDGSGYIRITSFVNARNVLGLILQHLPANLATVVSHFWSEGAWSTVQGFPRGITFDQQRLALCGTNGSPPTIWESETGSPFGFKAGVTDDAATIFDVQSNQVNALIWLVRGRFLFAGTNGGEYSLTGGNEQVITATNPPNVAELGAFGSADIQPVKVGQNVIFVQRGARVLREIVFNATAQSVLGPEDVTILAEHITQSGIKELAYQQAPNPTVLALRNDGQLATLTYFPKEDIRSWARRKTDGVIESVATIPTSTGDQVWILVRRTVGITSQRFLEYYDPAVITHATVSVANPPTVPITNASHLIGKTVSLIADGELQGMQTVLNDGTVTPAATCAVMDIGLPVVPTIRTVRPEVKLDDGSSQGRLKRWITASARVHNTRKITLNGVEHVLPSTVTDGDLEFTNLGYDKDGRLSVQSTDTRKATVLGLFGVLEVGDA